MSSSSPILLWFRRDLRLSDHPALSEALVSGRPVIPVFVHDEVVETHGSAPRWRLGQAVGSLAAAFASKGSRLILRRGPALAVLRDLIEETGATAVWWTRLYDPDAKRRDTGVKSALTADGIEARSFAGHVLFEPWTVETKTGSYYKVFTPMWAAVRGRDVGAPLATPGRIPAPGCWPQSDDLSSWQMGAGLDRGGEILARHARVGEAEAAARLGEFVEHRIGSYGKGRDFPGVDATSGLSENLTCGEVSVRTCWHAGRRAMEEGKAGAETFLKELVWREFACQLAYHTPHIVARNWRADWDGFPWKTDESSREVRAWKTGRTGILFVDAAMREMYVTGRMHNRARMIVASYLTKHLLTHWKVGMRWFEDCLTDWDPASNAMGWQWAAGSGPDAAPYFRVFNPVTQLEKFDPDGTYRRRWIAEGQADPPSEASSYFEAIPRRWRMSATDAYPAPVIGAAEGRQRALAAYELWRS